MNRTEIIHELHAIIKRIAPDTDPATLGEEEDLRRSLEIDSFDHLRMLTAINERFNIPITESEYGRLTSLGALADFVIGHKGVIKE